MTNLPTNSKRVLGPWVSDNVMAKHFYEYERFTIFKKKYAIKCFIFTRKMTFIIHAIRYYNYIFVTLQLISLHKNNITFYFNNAMHYISD